MAVDAARFEHIRQPAGHRNDIITIGTDGPMSALRQVLTPANFDSMQFTVVFSADDRVLRTGSVSDPDTPGSHGGR